jgi:hypothetical protein
MDTCACLTMNGVGKPCAGEPHARFDRGPLGRLTHPAGAAGPGPVCFKMPPRWPGRDLNRRCDLSNQRPTSPVLFEALRFVSYMPNRGSR